MSDANKRKRVPTEKALFSEVIKSTKKVKTSTPPSNLTINPSAPAKSTPEPTPNINQCAQVEEASDEDDVIEVEPDPRPETEEDAEAELGTRLFTQNYYFYLLWL